jgi:hypothetical protein
MDTSNSQDYSLLETYLATSWKLDCTVLPAARFTLPPALTSFTGTSPEMGTVFDPKPAVDSALPKMSAYEADATTQPADDYLPVLSVVQTTAAVLTVAGEFSVRDLGMVVANYV